MCAVVGLAGIAGVVAAAIVGLTLLFLTPVFELMPMNALAAIVIVGVLGLIDPGRALYLLQVSLICLMSWPDCIQPDDAQVCGSSRDAAKAGFCSASDVSWQSPT